MLDSEVRQRQPAGVEGHVTEDTGEEVTLELPVAADCRVVHQHQLRTSRAPERQSGTSDDLQSRGE